MHSILIPLTSGLLTLASFGAAKPNIVYILADDMGVSDIAYGKKDAKVVTPNLDQLASNGLSFTDAHSGSSVCTPTRYALMTGRYCFRSPVKGKVIDGYGKALITADRETVPKLLKRNGYTTAMFGKWHLGLDWQLKDGSHISTYSGIKKEIRAKVDFSKPFANGPIDAGFDSYFGINASLDFGPYTWLVDKKVQTIPNQELDKKAMGKKNKELKLSELECKQRSMRPDVQAADFDPQTVLLTLTERTVDYIEKYNADKPFFIYLALPSPHTPVFPRKEFLGTSKAGVYGDFISETDWTVGQVIGALKKKDLLKNTLVIFTADNGASRISFPVEFEEKFGHKPSGSYKGRKGRLDEGGHRVPFIVQWPASVKPGTTTSALTSLNDLYATCVDLLDAQTPKNASEDSISMLPALLAQSKKGLRTQHIHQDFAGSLGIRSGDWKLNMGKMERTQKLFNLAEDPEEKKSVLKQNPEKKDALLKELTAIIQQGRSTPGPALNNDAPQVWPALYWMK